MASKIRIAIVDDHLLFRKGLIQLFNSNEEFDVVFEGGDGIELLEAIENTQVVLDVILLDVKMPRINGIECLSRLNEILPSHNTIILSMYDDNPIVKKSLKYGAKGYLLKNTEPEELFKAVKKVYDTGFYISAELSKNIIKNIQKSRNIDELSAFNPMQLNSVEVEVLGHICQGLTNSEIAELVHRSKRTIEGYRQKLINKTNTKNTAALVAWAFRKGVVE